MDKYLEVTIFSNSFLSEICVFAVILNYIFNAFCNIFLSVQCN